MPCCRISIVTSRHTLLVSCSSIFRYPPMVPIPAGVRKPLTTGDPFAAAGVPLQPVNFVAVLPAHWTRVPLTQMVLPLTNPFVDVTKMLFAPAAVAAVSVVAAAPDDKAIGGRLALMGP